MSESLNIQNMSAPAPNSCDQNIEELLRWVKAADQEFVNLIFRELHRQVPDLGSDGGRVHTESVIIGLDARDEREAANPVDRDSGTN